MENNTAMRKPKIGFIGFGEVTFYLSQGLISEGLDDILVYSRAFIDPSRREMEIQKGQALGVNLTSSLEEVFAKSDLVFSSIRGDQALKMAEDVASFCRKGQLFVDLNNAIPEVKEKSAVLIENNQALYVDVGLLELPIQVGHRALMYASGKGAERFRDLMQPYNMKIHYLGDNPGKAALIKAIANIYMKGIQGICLEFAISAHQAGVDLDLLQPLLIKPLENLERIEDVPFWIIRGSLLASRKKTEMEEAVKMLRTLHIDPIMLEAAIERLNRISQFDLNSHFSANMSTQDYKQIISKMVDVGTARNIPIS